MILRKITGIPGATGRRWRACGERRAGQQQRWSSSFALAGPASNGAGRTHITRLRERRSPALTAFFHLNTTEHAISA
jgi:hypothetical protein